MYARRGQINLHSNDKIFSSCALFGMINLTGERFASREPLRAISSMRERGNGLGGGFAIYGIYPDFRDLYAFHVMYMDWRSKSRAEKILMRDFRILFSEEIPTKNSNKLPGALIFWRYFLEPEPSKIRDESVDTDEYVVRRVMKINAGVRGAYVISSGKNMGVFKGVGFPEDIEDFFHLDEYKGYMWICHARFPTNTPGWWGGAHPFNILDWSVAHNGELSSYGVNRRYLEMQGYKCVMQTDTEVLAYAFDLLARRRKVQIELIAKVLSPTYWEEIDSMENGDRVMFRALRQAYGSLMMNGPFSIIVAHHGEMIGLADRKKLRPLVAGIKGNFLYISSEESAIRLISPNVDRIIRPSGGEMIIGRLRCLKVLEVPTLIGRCILK
ncbi:MAG: glutamine amidotransferase family protein [Candidatus Bathyarchaeia archaeon]